MDSGGAARCLKSGLFGLTCLAPDAVILTVAANTGVSHMTREHRTLALALRLPCVAVVTKADAASPERCEQSVAEVQALLGGREEAAAPLVEGAAHAAELATRFGAEGGGVRRPQLPLCPVFVVSSVTGEGLDALHAFLAALNARRHGAGGAAAAGAAPAQFQVEEVFGVEGVGAVVSGAVTAGTLCVGQRLLLGPTPAGDFRPVIITGIHAAQVAVSRACVGQAATLALSRADAAVDAPSTLPLLSASAPLGSDASPGASLDAAVDDDDCGFDFDADFGFEVGPPRAVARTCEPPLRRAAPALGGTRGALGSTLAPSCAGARLPEPSGGVLLGFGFGSLSGRKGLVLLQSESAACTAWEFEAQLALVVDGGGSAGSSEAGAPVRAAADATGATSAPEHPGTPDGGSASLPSLPRPGSLLEGGGSETEPAPPLASARRKRRTRPDAWPLPPWSLAVVHAGSVRQAARVVGLVDPGADVGTSLPAVVDGDGPLPVSGIARLRFRFLHRPEWLAVGALVVVRTGEGDQRVTAAGMVTAVHAPRSAACFG